MPPRVHEEWFIDLRLGTAQLRCRVERRGKAVLQYLVQIEIVLRGEWTPIVRHDNAHGFDHRDVIHVDGTQEKEPLSFDDFAQALTLGIKRLRTEWRQHAARFLREVRHDRSKKIRR